MALKKSKVALPRRCCKCGVVLDHAVCWGCGHAAIACKFCNPEEAKFVNAGEVKSN